MFAGHNADCPDGDNPRHDAMTPFNDLLYRDHVGQQDRATTGSYVWIGQDGTDYQVLFSLHNFIGDESRTAVSWSPTIFSTA